MTGLSERRLVGRDPRVMVEAAGRFPDRPLHLAEHRKKETCPVEKIGLIIHTSCMRLAKDFHPKRR